MLLLLRHYLAQATTTATVTKTSLTELKVGIHVASNLIALIPSRLNSSNVGKFFRV